jgi:hypothetical protein
MEKGTVVELRGPERTKDALTELQREGAQRLIGEAVEAELRDFLECYQELRLADGRQ